MFRSFIIGNCVFDQNSRDVEINAEVRRALIRAVAEIPQINHYHFMIEDQKTGEESPHYAMSLISVDEKGGSCAPEKMFTLKNHPEISSTNDMKGRELAEGEVQWFGGISVPYIGHEGVENTSVSGVVRVVFSGSQEAVDLIVVLKVLKAYIEVCEIYLTDSSYDFDLSGLWSNPLAGSLLSLIGFEKWAI
jgi:hypothetical protein